MHSLKRYEKWQDIVALSGPAGLRVISGFHDESLSGQWKGYRSSRLGLQYWVIYRVFASSKNCTEIQTAEKLAGYADR
jgi:mRNA-degrading endonuclease YafQ of YafQ-DinJ toxin-antitoxin module